MRSLGRVKLTFPIRHLSRELVTNHGSCKYSINHANLRKQEKMASQDLPDKVNEAIEIIAKDQTQKLSKEQTLYLVDKEAAKKFAALIAPNIKKNLSYVAEINSGLGFLSKELLEHGISLLNLFEGIPYLIPNLVKIIDKYPGSATLRPVSFQHMWSVGYLDWKDNSNNLEIYFDNVEKRSWTEQSSVQIVGALADIHFIRRLMSTVVFRNTLAKFGRIALHVAMPPSVWAHLTCSNENYDLYRWHCILFQTLFNYELLGTLPRSAFYPYYRQPKRKIKPRRCRQKIMKDDKRLMNVVKVELKADLFKHDFTVADIVPFYYFLHYHLKSRASRVIPALEKWVPGCGRTLIRHGFNIYTEFGELTPEEILNLFKIFRSWPEFKQSSFVSCMDSFLMRIENHVGFDANSDNLEEMFEFSLDDTQLPPE